jgi:hypothetical protein
MENLARYIIRASFSQERMTYIPEETKGIYQYKDGKGGRSSTPSNGSPPYVLMYQTRENRWSDITATIVMSVATSGKSRIKTE